MNRIKHFLLLIGFILTYSCVYSQTVSVRGVVRDAKETLIGVNVVIMNAENRVYTGISTDVNGGYMLKMPSDTAGLYLSFSFIGYRTKKVAYTGQKVLNMKLETDAQLIDEVIITATIERNEMGISYKNLSSSVERMKMDGIDEMPVTSIGDALQGKLANVDIVSSSGAPGSGMSIRIRGISSLSTSSEPLIVLDGVPKETDLGDDFDFATASDEDLSGLVNLSPGDIESMEVLKDASATAIYGPRGANGVLLITTKQGVVGPMRLTVNQKISYNFETEPIERLDGKQYIAFIQDALWNDGLEGTASSLTALSAPEINFDPTDPNWKEFNQNTNWLDEITRNGFLSETTAALSGGGERTIYNFSLGYLTEKGTTVGTAFKRLNSRLNLTYKFSDRFKVTTGIAFSQGVKNDHFESTTRAVAMKHMPNVSPYIMEDDAVTRTSFYFAPENILNKSYPNLYNVVAMANETKKETTTRNVDLNLGLNYDFAGKLKGLKYAGIFSFDIGTNNIDAFLPHVVTGAIVTSDDYNQGRNESVDNTQLYIDNKLIFIKTFKSKHSVTATAKVDITDKRSSKTNSVVAGMSSIDLSNPIVGAGRIITFTSTAGNNRDFGFVFNGNYVYDLRYIFNFAYRYGANSRINKMNRWKGTPAFSAAWRVDSEKFMEDCDWISELKLRASWGINLKNPSGNSPGMGEFTTGENYGPNGTVGPSSLSLTNLTYETLDKTNVGIDVSFFNNKLTFAFDYYRNVTKDLLQRSADLPSHTGYKTISYFNSGEMSNEGWEFRGTTSNLLPTSDYFLSLRFNMAGNKNIMIELPENVNYLQYKEVITNGEFALNVQEGDALGSFYGFRSLGVYKDTEATFVKNADGSQALDILGNPVQLIHNDRTVSAGDAIYEDINNDGIIDEYDIVYIGNSMPKFTGGAGFTLGYKNLSLTTYFHARLGYDIINDARMRTENMSNYDNQNVNVLRRWRHEGDETDIPKALFGDKRSYNWLGSDRFVEDGSFIRLKELSLKYTLPSTYLKRWGISKFSMFVTGYDLFTWTKYSGQEPEVSINGGLNQQGKFELMGVDKAKTPKPRRISMGLNIQF